MRKATPQPRCFLSGRGGRSGPKKPTDNTAREQQTVIGTSDVNVTFNHTMRLSNAFIKAKKFFDLIVMPGETHRLTSAARAYYREARARYFVEHLKPYEPAFVSEGTGGIH